MDYVANLKSMKLKTPNRAKLVGAGLNDDRFERAYGELQYGAKCLGERNNGQLDRYIRKANKEGGIYNYE